MKTIKIENGMTIRELVYALTGTEDKDTPILKMNCTPYVCINEKDNVAIVTDGPVFGTPTDENPTGIPFEELELDEEDDEKLAGYSSYYHEGSECDMSIVIKTDCLREPGGKYRLEVVDLQGSKTPHPDEYHTVLIYRDDELVGMVADDDDITLEAESLDQTAAMDFVRAARKKNCISPCTIEMPNRDTCLILAYAYALVEDITFIWINHDVDLTTKGPYSVYAESIDTDDTDNVTLTSVVNKDGVLCALCCDDVEYFQDVIAGSVLIDNAATPGNYVYHPSADPKEAEGQVCVYDYTSTALDLEQLYDLDTFVGALGAAVEITDTIDLEDWLDDEDDEDEDDDD